MLFLGGEFSNGFVGRLAAFFRVALVASRFGFAFVMNDLHFAV